ncbi:NACHT domain-containing protein [Pseudomonas sp. OTU5201]|uniref:NACHT domain-containing protein n=1 Tax=Pseudomonas sp. OTU5201 TaxID=3043850 RepID=UPI00313D2951
MTPKAFLPRTLWYVDRGETVELQQDALLQLTPPLVILGEAGIGKSRLLTWLATKPDYAFCTARKLINRPNPRSLLGEAKVLVIDALDEVSAVRDGDAVNQVLRQLGELDYPRFVLACRSVDWRSATGTEAIREQYEKTPLELTLNPFSGDEVSAFLEQMLGPEQSSRIVAHFDELGLGGMLGNPQTLELIIPAITGGELPQTRSELFELAVRQMAHEHNVGKLAPHLPEETALNSAGAAFAALLLSGSEVITRRPALIRNDDELPLPEIGLLAGGEHVASVLGSRLFRTVGPDRFGYWHRRIAEYLGARYLAQQADTPRKRRRMLAIFQSHGLVPASLRGLHAWLADDPALAQDVISADPMGLIEYGDPDNLAPAQARLLLNSLKRLAVSNPEFRPWRTYVVRGLAQAHLVDDLRNLITSKEAPFGLRLLVLESMPNTPTAPMLQPELQFLVEDPGDIFALRRAAIEALLGHISDEAWARMVGRLRDCDDELTIRLALELIGLVGYAPFNDELIATLILKYAVKKQGTAHPFYSVEKGFPAHRLDAFLDHFATCLTTDAVWPEDMEYDGEAELTDFTYRLIARRLEITPVEPESLWRWLRPLDCGKGFDKEPRQQLHNYLQRHDQIRQAIQRMVMLDASEERSAWQKYWKLHRTSTGFYCTEADAIVLLAALNPTSSQQDETWKEIVQLVSHDEERGAEVRNAALPFARGRAASLEWISRMTSPPPLSWKIEQDERRQIEQEEREKRNAENRKLFTEKRDQVRHGEYGAILGPAQAYLKFFRDIGDGVPAHERVAQWLGAELAEAAHAGFEAYLKRVPAIPTADDIAQSHAEGMEYKAAYIVVAALAERVRNGVGLDDLSDERVMAGLFVVKSTKIDQHAGIVELEPLLEAALRARGCWSAAMRKLIEPQLQAARDHVSGLHELVQDNSQEHLVIELVIDWLRRFTALPDQVECLLIDKLLAAGKNAELRRLCNERNCVRESQKRNWAAVGFIVDFERTAAAFSASEIPPELLWAIRDRGAERHHMPGKPSTSFSSEQLEWLISTFRKLWVHTASPMRGWCGDINPWDASEFLRALIRRLGNDSSSEATKALARLRDAPFDGYTDTLRAVSAEHARSRVEADYLPPTMAAIVAFTHDRPPIIPQDLQTWLLEELSSVQAKVLSDDAESWRGFYDDASQPHPEERCRDHLLGLLRQGTTGVSYEPETHVAGDKEVDIACSAGALRLPIEVKGQWHRQLWDGADRQLDRLYTPDWRAGGHGIYLVLWFGENVPASKRLVTSRNWGTPPSSPEDLQQRLVSFSYAAQEGRVAIVVLDLSRP